MANLIPGLSDLLAEYETIPAALYFCAAMLVIMITTCIFLKRKHKKDGLVFSEPDRRFIYYCGKLLKGDGFQKIHIINEDPAENCGELCAEKDGNLYLIYCVPEEGTLNDDIVDRLCCDDNYYRYDYLIIFSNRLFTDKETHSADKIGLKLWGNNRFCDLEEKLAEKSL